MKSVILYLIAASAIGGATAFSPIGTQQQNRFVYKSVLRYNIITPPDDDNCEIDNSNCEESVFARKKREKNDENEKMRKIYAENGLNLRDIDLQESIDQVSSRWQLTPLRE